MFANPDIYARIRRERTNITKTDQNACVLCRERSDIIFSALLAKPTFTLHFSLFTLHCLSQSNKYNENPHKNPRHARFAPKTQAFSGSPWIFIPLMPESADKRSAHALYASERASKKLGVPENRRFLGRAKRPKKQSGTLPRRFRYATISRD